jgi:hypothetical protein
VIAVAITGGMVPVLLERRHSGSQQHPYKPSQQGSDKRRRSPQKMKRGKCRRIITRVRTLLINSQIGAI